MSDIRRLLIATRGVSARRILRALHGGEIETAVLTSDTDEESSWPNSAAYSMYIAGPSSPPWPKPVDVVGVSLDAGCDIVHPGWGGLARSAELAVRLKGTGLQFVGASHELLSIAADRVQIRHAASQVGIHVVPGSGAISELSDAAQWLSAIGFPSLAKTIDGESGRSSIRLTSLEDAQARLPALLDVGPIYLERVVMDAREIEVLVVGDGEGEALTLGERETSVQPGGRRAFAESPVPGLVAQHASRLRQSAAALISRLKWPGLISVRFLVTPDGRGYLLRLRPGLQPWHGVSELTLGVDLVDAQVRIAMGETLGWEPHHLAEEGVAFCLRVFSTDTEIRTLTACKTPDAIRTDTGFDIGDQIAPGEEILQLLVSAPTRQTAIVRARVALDEIAIEGVQTNLSLFVRLFNLKDFWNGPLDRDRVNTLLQG